MAGHALKRTSAASRSPPFYSAKRDWPQIPPCDCGAEQMGLPAGLAAGLNGLQRARVPARLSARPMPGPSPPPPPPGLEKPPPAGSDRRRGRSRGRYGILPRPRKPHRPQECPVEAGTCGDALEQRAGRYPQGWGHKRCRPPGAISCSFRRSRPRSLTWTIPAWSARTGEQRGLGRGVSGPNFSGQRLASARSCLAARRPLQQIASKLGRRAAEPSGAWHRDGSSHPRPAGPRAGHWLLAAEQRRPAASAPLPCSLTKVGRPSRRWAVEDVVGDGCRLVMTAFLVGLLAKARG